MGESFKKRKYMVFTLSNANQTVSEITLNRFLTGVEFSKFDTKKPKQFKVI